MTKLYVNDEITLFEGTYWNKHIYLKKILKNVSEKNLPI